MSKKANLQSQNKKILHYLETHKRGITSVEAFEKLRITRLASRIHDLRQMGYPVSTFIVQTTNEDGRVVRYARYTIN